DGEADGCGVAGVSSARTLPIMQAAPSASTKPLRRSADNADVMDKSLPARARKTLLQPVAVRNSGRRIRWCPTDHDSGIGHTNFRKAGSVADADNQHELTAAPYAAAAQLALQWRERCDVAPNRGDA